MSVEDIQKVNELAQELLKKGFAQSRDQAVDKAQKMLNKEIASESNSPVEEEKVEDVKEDNTRNTLERMKDQMQRQFTGFKNALTSLEKEINDIKQQVEEIKARGISKPVEENNSNGQKPQKEHKKESSEEKQQKIEENDDNGNPRTGKNDSEDVSIEKMFYYGNN